VSGGADEIQVLSWHEAVRRRPGLYADDIEDGTGLHGLIWKLVADVTELHAARHATELHVDVAAGSWITIGDDGPGIPAVHPEHEARQGYLEHVATNPFVGGARALRLGLALANALSTRVDVETTWDGIRWAQSFARGEAITKPQRLDPTTTEGTWVRFQPDPTIFRSIDIDLERVRNRLQEIAWLHPLLRVFFQGRRLHGRGGLRSWVEHVASPTGGVDAVYSTAQSCDGGFVEVALAWTRTDTHTLRCFVDSREDRDGTQGEGLWLGLAAFARNVGARARTIEQVREALRPGLVAIVAVRSCSDTVHPLEEPTFEAAVARVVEQRLPRAVWLDPRLRALLAHRLGFTWTSKHVPRP
jgi:DNA gyrase subunit B